MNAPATIIDDALLGAWPLPQPGPDSDKEARGLTLIIAGSREMPGAAWLAATAALRAGAGKLVVATAASVAPGLALSLPEARVIALPESADGGLSSAGIGSIDAVLEHADALLIGPGLQDESASCAFANAAIGRVNGAAQIAVILDALAMNVSGARFARPVLLTPHAGEMAHLTGMTKDEVCSDPERVARAAAERWNAVVALKGAITFIASPQGRVWRHEGGSVGLATSGSGDTLAGIVTGLAARGAPLEQAAVYGVALHARAGDALTAKLGPLGYLASELLGEIPRLMHRLSRPKAR